MGFRLLPCRLQLHQYSDEVVADADDSDDADDTDPGVVVGTRLKWGQSLLLL